MKRLVFFLRKTKIGRFNAPCLALILILCLGLAGCQAPGPSDTFRLRVLTYNIHHAEGTDGRIDYDRIARVIREASPDLVALQEVDQRTTRSAGVDQAGELGRLTGMHAAFGKSIDYAGGGYGNAILSRWPIAKVETHLLPASPGHETRSVVVAAIQTEDREPPLLFASTHWDHLKETERMNQAKRCHEMLQNLKDPSRSILAGDLNAVPQSSVMQWVLEHWSDAARFNPEPTIPAEKPVRRIDYILYHPEGGWRVAEARVLDEPIASDHRPVLAIIERVSRKRFAP